MLNAAARLGGRYAAPAAATGTLLALSLSPAVAHAKEAKADVGELSNGDHGIRNQMQKVLSFWCP